MYVALVSTGVFLNSHAAEIDSSTEASWDTTAITPGTKFMANLASSVSTYFSNPKKFNVKDIHI